MKTYRIKKEKSLEISEKYRKDYFSKTIGTTQGYMCQILNGTITCSKRLAYCISKVLNENYEVEDVFNEEYK